MGQITSLRPKCANHPLSGHSQICTQCLSIMDEGKIRAEYAEKYLRKEVATLQQALKEVPGVVDGLFEEGLLYKNTLLKIVNGTKCTCAAVVPSNDLAYGQEAMLQHLVDCPRGIARAALKGCSVKMLAKKAAPK